jgi:hypothetical protein
VALTGSSGGSSSEELKRIVRREFEPTEWGEAGVDIGIEKGRFERTEKADVKIGNESEVED